MKQRARFACPVGGQPLVAVYDEKVKRLEVRPPHHQDPTEDTELWLAGLGWGLDRDLTINGARTLLSMGGVCRDVIEFEGI